MISASGWRKVHLLELPVPLAAKSQQHIEELLREFALIAADDPEDEHRVPGRLMELMDTLVRQFAGVGDEARDRLEAAIARGDRRIGDHVLDMPPEAAPASRALSDMLDEADEYCRRGQHLLTLATPQECVAYRRWYLGQVIDQLDGKQPTSWPQYREDSA